MWEIWVFLWVEIADIDGQEDLKLIYGIKVLGIAFKTKKEDKVNL